MQISRLLPVSKVIIPSSIPTKTAQLSPFTMMSLSVDLNSIMGKELQQWIYGRALSLTWVCTKPSLQEVRMQGRHYQIRYRDTRLARLSFESKLPILSRKCPVQSNASTNQDPRVTMAPRDIHEQFDILSEASLPGTRGTRQKRTSLQRIISCNTNHSRGE